MKRLSENNGDFSAIPGWVYPCFISYNEAGLCRCENTCYGSFLDNLELYYLCIQKKPKENLKSI